MTTRAQSLGAGRWRVRLRGPDGPPAALSPDRILLRPIGPTAPPARVETVTVPSPSDPSALSLIVTLDTDDGFGPAGAFGYEVQLSGRDDWAARVDLHPGVLQEPSAAQVTHDPGPLVDLDYGARDFEALRSMMLSRLTESVGPDFGTNPASQGVALVEQLAYLGDSLSYYQDAVATEAYLTTARRRVSVTRHAALLDYQVGQGSSSRTWVRVNVAASEPFLLKAGTKLLSHVSAGAVMAPEDLAGALESGALIFETLADVSLQPEREPKPLTPAAGADRIQDMTSGTIPAQTDPPMVPGDLVLIQPQSGFGPLGGQVVRLQAVEPATTGQDPVTLTWAQSDVISASSDLLQSGAALAVWPGNLVLADHGSTQDWATLPPPARGARYWPVLPSLNTTVSAGTDDNGTISAADLLAASDLSARAAVELREIQDFGSSVATPGVTPDSANQPEVRYWTVRPSLLESGPLALDFVVETEDDGTARLRFGDGTHGMQPEPDAMLQVRQRVGGGAQGNIGAGGLAHIVLGPGSIEPAPPGAETRVQSVTNPMPTIGGSDPEALSAVRLHAPDAFRVNDRIVTLDDYVARARMTKGIVDVSATLSSTGSWPVVVIYVQTTDRWNQTDEGAIYRSNLAAALGLRQSLGFDVEVRPAVPLPLSAIVDVTVAAGWAFGFVGPAIDQALIQTVLAPGFFTFGRALYQSDLIALLGEVDGVTDVTVSRFGLVSDQAGGPSRDVILPPVGYVLRVDNDATTPAHGTISYRLRASR